MKFPKTKEIPKIKEFFENNYLRRYLKLALTTISVISLGVALLLIFYLKELNQTGIQLDTTREKLKIAEGEIHSARDELEELRNQDQYLINQGLKKEVDDIQKTYKQAVIVYEDLLYLKGKTKTPAKLDDLFAKSLNLLSQRNYASAAAVSRFRRICR